MVKKVTADSWAASEELSSGDVLLELPFDLRNRRLFHQLSMVFDDSFRCTQRGLRPLSRLQSRRFELLQERSASEFLGGKPS